MAHSIAFLCDQHALDPGYYSSGHMQIYNALCKHAGDVTILDPGWHAAQPLRRLISRLPLRLELRLRWRVHLALAPVIAKGIEAELRRGRFDVVFCAYSLWSLSHVRVPPGMVSCFTSDTTQTVFQSSEVGAQHNGFRWSRPLDGWVERNERRVLRGTNLVLWPSQWQMTRAQALYGLAPGQAHCLPWGANLGEVPPPLPRALDPKAPVQLLLIGRDWHAKGGPTAFRTMQALRTRGLDARLTVIGCMPPPHNRNDFVDAPGKLNKTIPAEAARFQAALEQAHFLVQPSYESYGFAFCEASAYGLPSLCLRAGGVPIEDGVNGYALPLGSDAEAFADVIQRYVADPEAYRALSASSRMRYETDLNWDVWGQRTARLLDQAIAAKR